VDVNLLRTWIGRSESYTDQVTRTPVAALAATLDRDDPMPCDGDPLPPLWHWLYFLPIHRASEIGPDGHARRGGFLPPVPLPHRMFAGGRYVFERPLRVGDHMTRESRIVDVQPKTGRSGPLVFVVVRHQISTASGPALVEEHDIVYRDGARSAPSTPDSRRASERPAWSHEVRVDDVMLFRYSALTFNGHRIHYDRRYATEVEGYPGLVVHAPLVATLMLELLRRDTTTPPVAEFSFRAINPIFDVAPFFVCGRRFDERTAHLWAARADGTLAMDATATLRTSPLT
jgi:3-methylfumaryl-CoA hydratase